MEQYPVPQFIEEESRIISFITFKQFFALVGAGATIFIIYWLVPRFIFYIAAALIAGGTIGAMFFKIDGIPVLQVVMGSIGFLGKTKNYTWKKKESLFPFKTVQKTEIKQVVEHKPLGVGQKSSLKNLRSKVELNINK